jgi:phosphomannomutase
LSRRASETPIKFGTDGWRAIIADDFTFANLERVAQAYADYLSTPETAQPAATLSNKTQPDKARTGGAQTTGSLVIVGYDRRFLSEQFALRAAQVLAGNGFRVALFDEAVPTPLISWAVREQGALGGVVITASHNPAEFNGFKIKAPWGGSASPEITAAVEALMDQNPPRREELSEHESSENSTRDMLLRTIESYRAQIASYIDLERLRSAPHRVVIDPMHGSGGRWVESFLEGGQLNAETIRAARDPLFGGVHPEPIDRNLGPLKKRVTEAGAILGLATDGDADRLGAVNERGETMTMHEVVPLLLLHLARTRGMSGGVVRTFSQSVLTKRIASAHNLPLYDTPIGFKYIADLMLKQNILLGAEESGGIGVQGHIPERDGVLNCLLLLEAVIMSGKPPSQMVREMHSEFGEFYFGRRDIHVDVKRGQDLVAMLASAPPTNLTGFQVSGVETMDGTKLLFEDESWLLFRQSGTEPVLRIYSEATSTTKMEALLDQGVTFAEEHTT